MPKPKGYKESDSCGICRFVFMYTEFGGDDPRFVCELNMPEDMPKPNRDHDDLHLFSCMMSDEEWNRWWKFAEENQVKANGVCDFFLKEGLIEMASLPSSYTELNGCHSCKCSLISDSFGNMVCVKNWPYPLMLPADFDAYIVEQRKSKTHEELEAEIDAYWEKVGVLKEELRVVEYGVCDSPCYG